LVPCAGLPGPIDGELLLYDLGARVFHLAFSDHKQVGKSYLWLAMFGVVLGMVMSVAMRQQMAGSGGGLTGERYTVLALVHGSLMVFFVLTAAPQFGFGYFLLPLQIGANEMAFPLFSGLSLMMTAGSMAGMASSFFLPVRAGMTLWLFSVVIFCGAAILSAVNFCTTVTGCRTSGMTLTRLPLTVWAWYVNAVLSLLIFGILLAACVLLFADWFAGTQFFAMKIPSPASLPAVWQRWFRFFAQAEVYVAMLPCFGIVSHLIATFARRPVWNERAVILSLCAVGMFGFSVWGFHMFSSALNPYSPLIFSMLAASLGVPASVLFASWLATLWNGAIRLTTAMLFAIGFVSLFLSGGVSGLLLAQRGVSSVEINDEFVTGHFHLVMGIAATFAILGALFFWFPKIYGARLNETLGKLHFWLTFAGVYCVFMPMHWLGLLERMRVGAVAGVTRSAGLRQFVSMAAMVTIAGQMIFLANFFRTLARPGRAQSRNPWHATTLEWTLPSPVPSGDFGEEPPLVYRGAYLYGECLGALDFWPQHVSPERLAEFR
jgi:cytochrome c oxidase subunit 1